MRNILDTTRQVVHARHRLVAGRLVGPLDPGKGHRFVIFRLDRFAEVGVLTVGHVVAPAFDHAGGVNAEVNFPNYYCENKYLWSLPDAMERRMLGKAGGGGLRIGVRPRHSLPATRQFALPSSRRRGTRWTKAPTITST